MSLQCKVMEVLVLGFQKSFSVQKYIFKIVSYVTVLWFCFSRAGDLHLLLIFFLFSSLKQLTQQMQEAKIIQILQDNNAKPI